MTEALANKSSNGVEKATVVTANVQNEAGLVDEVELVIERGIARPIELENIEKGLTRLWQAAAKPRPGQSSEDHPVMRACVFNLVICVEGDQQLADVTEVIAQITWAYPCRAIVLDRKPDDPSNQTTASISAHCQMPTNGKRVCCEQITVVGTGTAADGLWSMVLPLLVPDLPVILWWPDDPCIDTGLFERLLDTADRLIVDSRTFVNASKTFARLAELSKEQYFDTSFSDLGWSRLTPWRSLLAQFFDLPNYLPYLNQVDRIEIQYEAPDDHQHPNFSEALLLVGWLANQLGWVPAFNLQRKGANATLILNQHGTPLTVSLIGHNDRADELGGITEVKLYASQPGQDEPRTATFTVTLSSDYQRAISFIEESGSQVVTRSFPMTQNNVTDLLCQDLSIVNRDHIYEATLDLAGQLNQE